MTRVFNFSAQPEQIERDEDVAKVFDVAVRTKRVRAGAHRMSDNATGGSQTGGKEDVNVGNTRKNLNGLGNIKNTRMGKAHMNAFGNNDGSRFEVLADEEY
ncbi:hypothetical protein ACOSQ2_029237 [Xanthoceras sorbifolium]